MFNKTTAKIIAFNRERLTEMLPYKYEAMQENPFRFFRGTAHLFYEEANTSVIDSPKIWTCGDMHLENFGSFRGANGLVYFDLNDFDDAALAPLGYELARMVTSIFIAFQSLKIGEEKATHMANLFIRSYCRTLMSRKPDHVEERTASGIVCSFLARAASHKKKRDHPQTDAGRYADEPRPSQATAH